MGAGITGLNQAEELCDPWLDFDCERVILTRINPSSLMPIVLGLASGINVGFHTLIFLWNNFHTGNMAWDWTSAVKAGYNSNITLSFAFKGS